MKYIVICERDLEKFTKAVNEKIKEGYELVGGISTSVIPNASPALKVVYSQALSQK